MKDFHLTAKALTVFYVPNLNRGHPTHSARTTDTVFPGKNNLSRDPRGRAPERERKREREREREREKASERERERGRERNRERERRDETGTYLRRRDKSLLQLRHGLLV